MRSTLVSRAVRTCAGVPLCGVLSRACWIRSRTCCRTARRRPSLLVKWCTTSPWVTPAARATSRMVVSPSPFAACSSIAALRMRALAVRSAGAAHSAGFYIVLYAAWRLGALVVPVNPGSPAPELQYFLEDSGAALLVFDAAAEQAVRKREQLPAPTLVAGPIALCPVDGYPDLFD